MILTVVAEGKDPHSVVVHCSVCIIFCFKITVASVILSVSSDFCPSWR